MPTISRFYGILIQMFYDDHAPPHFHATYQGFKAIYEISPVRLYAGKLPKRGDRLVREWARIHQEELLADWDAAEEDRPLSKIDPLE